MLNSYICLLEGAHVPELVIPYMFFHIFPELLHAKTFWSAIPASTRMPDTCAHVSELGEV